MKNNDWKNDKAVQNWFELIGNARTINNYSYDFPKFLSWAIENTPYKTPSEIIQNRVESLTTTDMQKRRYWEQQVIKYKNSLEAQNYRMATVHSSLRTIIVSITCLNCRFLFSLTALLYFSRQFLNLAIKPCFCGCGC